MKVYYLFVIILGHVSNLLVMTSPKLFFVMARTPAVRKIYNLVAKLNQLAVTLISSGGLLFMYASQ